MSSIKSPSAETLKALETVPNMYLILSPDLYILTASDLYLQATETKREAITGKHIFDAFPADPNFPDADGVKNINASLQEVLRTKKPHHMPIQRYDVPDRNHEGEFITRYWDPSHTPVLDDQGDILYIIQLAINITDKVLADMDLEKAKLAHEKTRDSLKSINNELIERTYSERHFRHLADLVPAKISNALPTGEVTFFNKLWLDYSGLNFEDLRDFGYHNMVHPDEIEDFQKGLTEAAANGRPYESEMRFKNTDGEYRWHLNIVSPILDEDGQIAMWVGSTTDIQRMKEEEQRKNDFIGMVSHELKTPLTSLSAYLQVLNSKLSQPDESFEKTAVRQAIKQTGKMTTMINGFLNLSRLEATDTHINKEEFNICKLLRDTVEDMSLITNTHRITLQPCDSKIISGDQEKIGYVLNNLISNACKYSQVGTEVNLSCEVGTNQVTVSITDEGMGIKEEEVSHLFERYYRVENSNTISGFGIGLYLCAEILKRHQGKIWVESEYGKGSTFYFSLPVA
ncbi:MAG: PAS domain-containing protein [Phormidesmis sp. FL-bin-119]|nr:PAS domain-containing protein [Pedobacter sp.]